VLLSGHDVDAIVGQGGVDGDQQLTRASAIARTSSIAALSFNGLLPMHCWLAPDNEPMIALAVVFESTQLQSGRGPL
jgi:hypothetical protein